MLKGWKTISVAIAVGAVGAAQQADWVQVIPAADTGYVLTGLAALMMILRAVTSTPVGKGS